MTNKVMVTRLIIVAGVTLAVFSALAGLLYVGLFYYRDIFDKLVVMIVPPLAALHTWNDYRYKRTRLRLPNRTVSARDWFITACGIAAYATVAFYLFERFEMLFLTVPVLIIFGAVYWLSLKNHREVAARSN